MDANWILIYDNECSLCCRFIGWIHKLDRNGTIEPVPFQEYSLNNTVPSREDLEADIHMIGPDGDILKGGGVLQKILELVPAMGPFRWMIVGKTGKGAANLAYLTMKRFRDCAGCGKRRRR